MEPEYRGDGKSDVPLKTIKRVFEDMNVEEYG